MLRCGQQRQFQSQPGQVGALLSTAGTSGIDRNKNRALTDLYAKEGQINSQAKNRANLFNAQATTRSNAMNAQLQTAADREKRGYIDEALGTVPNVMRDVRMDKADKEMRDVQNNYYKSMGKNYAQEGTLFDNKDGFTYIVRNGEWIKQGKTKKETK
jgi:hypothetical protein